MLASADLLVYHIVASHYNIININISSVYENECICVVSVADKREVCFCYKVR